MENTSKEGDRDSRLVFARAVAQCVATDGTATHVFGAAVRRFHDSRTAASHDGEAELRDGCAHLSGQLVIWAVALNPRGTENSHARADKMENPEAANKIAHHANESDELTNA